MSLDLTVVFAAGLEALFEKNKRGDEHLPHVSHLGKCLYQTQLSRERKPEIPRKAKDLQYLLKGSHDEGYIVDVLVAGFAAKFADEGWNVITGIVVSDEDFELTGHLDVELARTACDHNNWARYGPLTGWYCLCAADDIKCVEKRYDIHDDDCVIERRLVEIKTTQWFEQWAELGEIGKRGKPIKTRIAPGPYPEPMVQYRFQALGYARRRPLNPDGKHMPYTIFQWDRALNGWHQYPAPGEWYDSDDQEWVEQHDAWTWKIVELTAPGSDPIAKGIAYETGDGRLAGVPPEGKSCTYCPFAQCALNANPNNPALNPTQEVMEDVFA